MHWNNSLNKESVHTVDKCLEVSGMYIGEHL